MVQLFPELSSQRLRLGELSANDIPTIVQYAGNPKIAATTLNLPHPYAEKDAIYWLNMAHQGFKQGHQHIFGIYLKETNEFIGGIGLHLNHSHKNAEVGYWIAEPFWNIGFCSEALRSVLEYGFNQLKLHKIYARHLIGNPASGKVMIKNGMILEGELIDHYKKGNEYRSVKQYRLTKKEYDRVKNLTQ
jgi:ribosomal-protein-alanine N-acetyltransferase